MIRSLALSLTVVTVLGAAETTSPLNVIVYLVDDLGQRDLGCYGSASYATPAIDRLAAEGLRFTEAYSAYPRCVPSRFAMMSGVHPARATAGKSNDVSGRPTLGTAFTQAGYRTFYAGKWHLGEGSRSPAACGFQTTVAAGDAGATNSHLAPYNATGGGKKDSHKEAPIRDVDQAPAGEYLADRLTDEAIRFVTAAGTAPYLAVVAHYAVHTPIQGPPALIPEAKARIAALGLSGPATEAEGAGITKLLQDNAEYAAMVMSVDRNLARLQAAVAASGAADRTVIILTSDHGGLSSAGGGNKRELATSNRPWRAGKGHLYEGGIRVPLVVSGGKLPARSIDQPVVGTDLANLALGAAGLPSLPTSEAPAIDWAGILRHGAPVPARDLYWHNPEPRPGSTGDTYSSALRRGTWKLLDFYADQRVELYDLAQDPGEARNRAAEEPQVVLELKGQLDAWRTSIKADMSTSRGRPAKAGKE